jgi:UDP:flavonoid glycosyltransferase YjiC (YdhE family)
LKIFLGAFGQPGHAFPMLALGERLVQRGHKVTYETWSRWRPDAEAAGMEFVAAPEYPVFPTMERPLQPYEAVVRATPATRAAIAARRPDVVVHDILTLAPSLAAELEGVPVATLIPHVHPAVERGSPPYAIGARPPRTAVGRWLWRGFERPLEAGLRRGRREYNDARRQLGLPPVDRLHGGLSQQLCLVGTLPQLEYPRPWPDHVHVVGPLFWEAPYPDVTLPRGEGPLVLVAPSTAQDPSHRLLRAALAGLSGVGSRHTAPSARAVRVLATTNRRPLQRPVRAGRGAVLVDWLSYARTMPRAALVVCHAGHGTLARALACGVPVLAVPHVGDMGENAARLDWAGAGVRLPWRFLSAATLALAVRRALAPDAGYRERAAEIAAWSAANDGPTRAAELIERMASTHRRAASKAPGVGLEPTTLRLTAECSAD